jgi:MtN3 and saliva related transmembrane protein
MNFSLLDENVSLTMNIFIIIANIINLFYNIPQMIKTYRTKSTRDFSALFIILRIIANIIWLAYSIEINSFLMLINNLVTVIASVFIGYYKFFEMYEDYKTKPVSEIIQIEFRTSV